MSTETYNREMARVDLYKKLAEAEGITTNHLRGTYKMKKFPSSLFVPKSVLRAQGNCFAAWCHITKGDLILRLRQLSQVRIQRD